MITSRTNFCGRGTSIEYSNDYPLHVIISYGPRNARALGQAIGRTGRNGHAGTTRIICTKKAYYNITKVPKEDMINKILTDYDLKNKRQSSYISQFKKDLPWIFDSSKISSYNLFTDDEKSQLRESVINVNRNTAFNYECPLCLSIDTFIKIQLKKIYSLMNCPECKYTFCN